jgi:predicted transcriptional regulator
MTQRKRAARGKFTERVRKAVDDGADAAEEIHKKAVNLPLDLLERNGVLESTAEDIRRLQDQAIGAVYDLVRGINHEVVKLADDVLRPPPARPRARKRSVRKGGKQARVKKAKKTAAA